MHNNFLFKSLLFLVSIFFFVSCDKEYSAVGGTLIGENQFEFTNDFLSSVSASTKKTGAIASNNLEFNSLGVLDNIAFGETTANFATQVQLVGITPTIDESLAQNIESVTLYIPYFPKKIATDSNGKSTYTLDSIYGNKTSKIKLSIYENKYLLGKLNTEGDPAPLSDPSYPQFYYTSQNKVINDKKGILLYENKSFDFSELEHEVKTPAVGTTPEVKTYFAPGIRVELDKVFFKDLLFNKSNVGYDLSDNKNFEQYFKGLYFNVEKTGTNGALARINFKNGTIVVKYKEKTSSTVETLVDKTITLSLTGNTVNLFTNEPSTTVGSYSNPSPDRLYLRGGEGSIATIDLFNPAVDVVTFNRTTKKIEPGSNTIPDDLDYIKEKGWLINEASLTFYVDQTLMAGVTEPSKIFLYDINNQQVFSVGVIEKDASGRGLKYKVGITDYIRGIVNNEFTSVKLGVSVGLAVTNVKFKKTKDAPPYAQWQQLNQVEKNAYFFPESSVINPVGTILYGSNASVESKKLKLEIYYTKPK